MDIRYWMDLFDYNYWANDRLLRAAANLSHAQFVARVLPSHNSLRGTLVHVMSAEWIWLSRWRGTSPTAMLSEDSLPTLEAVRERWQQQKRNLRAFLATQNDESLERVVHYSNTQGAARAFPLWQLMAHLVNHGTQHRGEAAAMLTELGHSPGDMDLILFLQERSRAS